MDLLLVMTLSGSCFLLFYFLFKLLFKTLIAENVKYLMLKLSMFFLLVPPTVIKRICFPVSHYLGQNALDSGIYLSSSEKVKMFESTSNHVFYTSTPYNIFMIIGILWLASALLTFLYQVIKYLRNKKQMTQISEQITDPNILHLLQIEKEKLHLKRNLQLYTRNTSDSAFTIGILTPTIYLPSSSEPDLIQIIIRHELIHIKNFDILYKFLCILIRSIYWFNPLVYFLQKEIDTVSETCCDLYTIRSMDRNYRRLYAQLIIKNATVTNTSFEHPLVLSALNNNAKKTKERVELIMKLEKKSFIRSLLSLILSIAAVVSTSATAFAYQETQKIGWENKFNFGPDDYIIIGNKIPVIDPLESPVIFDKQIITQNGSIMKYEENANPRALYFVHTYELATFQIHNIQSSGSCTLTKYSGNHCIDCGSNSPISFISETKYACCPH